MIENEPSIFAFLVAAALLGDPPSTFPAAKKHNLATPAVPKANQPGLIVISQAGATDAANIISTQIRRQGYPCDEPSQAEHDRQASRPNETVWVLRCANAAYRVTLIPDMAARVELLK